MYMTKISFGKMFYPREELKQLRSEMFEIEKSMMAQVSVNEYSYFCIAFCTLIFF